MFCVPTVYAVKLNYIKSGMRQQLFMCYVSQKTTIFVLCTYVGLENKHKSKAQNTHTKQVKINWK